MRTSSEQRVANSQLERRASHAVWATLLNLFLLFAIPYSLIPLSAADPQRPIRESITLPVDGQVSKILLSVDEYLADRRYEELNELLANLAEAHGQKVVQVLPVGSRHVNRYVNVAVHCQAILCGLLPEGRAACRRLLDPQARRWYEAWQTTQDEQLLQQILNSAYISSYGDNALWELANAAWDRGDFSLARAYWTQLLKPAADSDPNLLHYPDAEFPAADVEARLILCDLLGEHLQSAERNLVDFQERHGSATGTLAGETGNLAAILNETMVQARGWHERDPNPGDTFGGSVERQHLWPDKIDVGPLHWSAKWQTRDLPQQGRFPLADRGPLRSLPAIHGDRVFLCDGDAIRGWRIFTGEPAWPNEQADPSVIYHSQGDAALLGSEPNSPIDKLKSRLSVEIDHLRAEGNRPRPDRPCAGVPWQTITVHRDRLFARLGSPVTGAARTELRDLSQELVCLDIGEGQGKLLWKLTNEDVPTAGVPWNFEGTPLVLNDTAYIVIYRRLPEPEFGLLALDEASGGIQWLRSIGSARPVVEEGVNRVSHLLLTAGDGRLYLSTDQGTLVCLSPQNGRLLWALSYESEPAELHLNIPGHLQAGLLPPLFWRGLLFVAPNDSTQLFCLDAATGRVLWQKKTSDRVRQLIGVVQSSNRKRLITGGNSLVSYDVDTGDAGWVFRQSEQSRHGYGQAVISGKSLFWPTREYLFQLDPATGDLQREIALRTPDSFHSGGNLAVAQGVLMVVEPNVIAVYGEYGLLKERLKIDLSQRPHDARLWQQMMELEAGAGVWDAAIAAGRRALASAKASPGLIAKEMQQRWKQLLRQAAEKKIADGDWNGADAIYAEISELSLEKDEFAQLLWDRSRLDLQRQHLSAAVNCLHRLISDPDFQSVIIQNEPAGRLASQELDDLLKTYGRDPFREIDQLGEEKLAAALLSDDAVAVRSVLHDFPRLASAPQVWSRLVDATISRQNWSELWPLMADWQSHTVDADSNRLILEKRAESLALAGYRRSAQRLQNKLRSGADASAAEFEKPDAGYVAKAWDLVLSENEQPLVPEGTPPDDSLACILLVGGDLQAVDRRLGTRRWRQNMVASPQWAVYGETDLLLADQNTLSARSLETGELVWQTHWDLAGGSLTAENRPVQAFPERLVALKPGRGVQAISTVSGETIWEFRPPRGRLQPRWLCTDESIVVQTLDPSETWVLNAATGNVATVGANAPQAWRRSPIACGTNRWAMVTSDRQVVSWTAHQGDSWKYLGGMSHAHADPWLLFQDGRLGLLIDGTTLVGLDPETGKRLWAAGLADQPIADPQTQMTTLNHYAAAVADGTARAVSLKDGRVVWQHKSLDAGSWSLQSWNNAIVAITPTTLNGAGAQLLMFRWFDGERLQMLRQPGSPNGKWHLDDWNITWVSPHRLAAWNPLPRERLQPAEQTR